MGADDILQGLVIGGFAFVSLSTLVYCIQKRRSKIFHMKKSSSMEDLNSVDTSDPTQTQDEAQYALPPVLVTKVSPHKGLSSVGM